MKMKLATYVSTAGFLLTTLQLETGQVREVVAFASQTFEYKLLEGNEATKEYSNWAPRCRGQLYTSLLI